MKTEDVLNQLTRPTLEYIWKGNKKKGRKKRGVIIASVVGNKVVIGFSLCHSKYDRFDYIREQRQPTFGVNIAADRAERWKDRHYGIVGSSEVNSDDTVPIPSSIFDKLSKFVSRCKRYRRYSGKSFPKWANHMEVNKVAMEWEEPNF